METLDTVISRRDLIKLAAAVAISPVLITNSSRRIHFEEALKNPKLRQTYIDQLVEKDRPYYTERVIYDPHKISAISAAKKLAEESLKELQSYKLDERYSKSIKERIMYKKYKTLLEILDDEHVAIIVHDNKYFGTNKKSIIYFFEESFKGGDIEVNGVNLKVLPSEELFRTYLRHEFYHCEEFFKGIQLNEKLRIDNSNYFRIDVDILDFIEETRVLIREIEFARQFNKKSNSTYEKYHPAYLLAIMSFFQFIEGKSEKIAKKDLSEYDLGLVETQLSKIESTFHEASSIILNLEPYMLKQK